MNRLKKNLEDSFYKHYCVLYTTTYNQKGMQLEVKFLGLTTN